MTLLSSSGATAQPVEIAASAGWGSYATGDDFNCGSNSLLGLGLELRTDGPFLVALGGDILAASGLDCTATLPLVPKGDGVQAREFTGLDLGTAPRVRIFLGARIPIDEVEVSPALGAGLVRTGATIRGEPTSWRDWAGFRVEGRWIERGPSLIVEHGWNRVPVRHEVFRVDEQGRVIDLGVERFSRWKPMTQVMLSVTL